MLGFQRLLSRPTLRTLQSFSTTAVFGQHNSKLIVARSSRFQIIQPNENKNHRRITRLLKRISHKEKLLGFHFEAGSQTSSSSLEQPNNILETSVALIRLYNEVVRPRQVSIKRLQGWDYNSVAKRVDHFWEHLSQSVEWNLEGPSPFIFNERLNLLLSFCNPTETRFLDHAKTEFDNLKENNDGSIDFNMYTSLIGKTLWCSGVADASTVLHEAQSLGVLTPINSEDFHGSIASCLGEGVGGFDLFIDLTQQTNIVLTRSMYCNWLIALQSRRGDKAHHFDFAKNYLNHPLLKGFEEYGDVRSALIRVAVHDRSPAAVDAAFDLLDTMSSNQTPSLACLNALAAWCANQRPSRSSMSFGDTHSRLTAIENIMVSREVKPSRRILGNLLAGYAHAGDAVSALGIYRNVKLRGMTLNASDYTFLIHSISNTAVPTPASWQLLADPIHLVLGLFQEVIAAGLLVNTNMLNAGLRVFTSTLRISKYLNQRAESFGKDNIDFEQISSSAISLFRDMVEGTASNPSVRPNATTYKYMITIHCLSDHSDRGLRLLDDMKSEGIQIDVELYNYLFEHLSCSDWRLAEDLLIVMTNSGLRPNSNTMNAFLKGFSKSGRIASGFSMIQGCFNQYGVRPSKINFLKNLEMLLESEDYHEAKRIGFIYRQLWPEEEEALESFMKSLIEKQDKRNASI